MLDRRFTPSASSTRRRRGLLPAIASVFVGVPLLLAPGLAHAGLLDACGGVFLESDASCELLVEGGCVAECEPPSFTAMCAAEGTVSCDGQCNAQIEASCTTDCQASCQSDCEVDPVSFECGASCDSHCVSSCSGECSAASNRAECEASCEASCGAKCEASCEGTPPSASCSSMCEASCDGSCEAKANMDCQIDCQSDFYVDCKADLQGECEVQCERPEGALFCEGQFISVGNLQTCLDQLASSLDVEVEASAEASADASIACSVTDDPARGGAALFGLGLFCLAATARRRRPEQAS